MIMLFLEYVQDYVIKTWYTKGATDGGSFETIAPVG